MQPARKMQRILRLPGFLCRKFTRWSTFILGNRCGLNRLFWVRILVCFSRYFVIYFDRYWYFEYYLLQNSAKWRDSWHNFFLGERAADPEETATAVKLPRSDTGLGGTADKCRWTQILGDLVFLSFGGAEGSLRSCLERCVEGDCSLHRNDDRMKNVFDSAVC